MNFLTNLGSFLGQLFLRADSCCSGYHRTNSLTNFKTTRTFNSTSGLFSFASDYFLTAYIVRETTMV